MHAYGHEWACQLVYNPRLVQGLGLTDGEGTERLWSRFIKLIGIERSSGVSYHANIRIQNTEEAQRQRRKWLIDRQAAAVSTEMLYDLGGWLKRRLKKGIREQGESAQKVLDNSPVPIADLWKQWADQREAQLSIRARELLFSNRLVIHHQHHAKKNQMHPRDSRKNSIQYYCYKPS